MLPNQWEVDPGHTVDRAWQWFTVQKSAIFRMREVTRRAILDGSEDIPDVFNGFTMAEFERAMDDQLLELGHLSAFNMLTATEAALVKDFRGRRKDKTRTAIGQALRAVHKVDVDVSRDVERLIDLWKANLHSHRTDFSNFKGSMKYRNWVAHGRHWTPNLGQAYTPEVIYDICAAVVDAIRVSYRGSDQDPQLSASPSA